MKKAKIPVYGNIVLSVQI